jgi:hypothetical protein
MKRRALRARAAQRRPIRATAHVVITAQYEMNRTAFFLMAAAIAFAAFAPIVPSFRLTDVIKALAETATGWAGLCMHPPGSQPTPSTPTTIQIKEKTP